MACRALLLVVLFVAAVQAQQPQPTAPPEAESQQPPRPTFRTGTNVVRVDATVLDRRGDPVTSLVADDFEVEEDGVLQRIDSLQLVRASGWQAAGDELSLPIRSPEHARAEAARESVRVFLIFWDEYHIDRFISAINGRRALADFVLNAFGPTDLVALMDPLLPLDAIRFTRDRRALADAIMKLQGRRGVFMPPRSALESAHLEQMRDINRVRAEVSLSALKAAAVFLGTLREGRKSIVYMSEGLRLPGGSGQGLVRDVVRAANDHNTAIYTVDPRGLGPRPSDLLLELADNTGGEAFVNTNAPDRGLRDVVKHASAYYLIGYSAASSPADGRFHRIAVRVKRSGMEVRARGGYWAPTAGDLVRAQKAVEAARLPPPVAEARSALAAASARRAVDLWIGSARGGEGDTAVSLAWSPHDTGRDPAYRAGALAVTARTADGRTWFEGKVEEGRTSFIAPPGLLELHVVVFDLLGEVLERDVRKVNVPDFSGARLSISSPVLLRARTALELRELNADPDAPPFVGRDFHRGDRLLVRFAVYGDGAAAATVTARLLSRSGTNLVTLPVVPVTGRGGTYQVDFPLSSVARGEFMIALEAVRNGEQVQSLLPLRIVS
jgi:VWFA-related protein